MAGILDSVNQRTQMVGQNRLELLLFRLGGRQRYGINVFKVREVLQCPSLTEIPRRHSVVRGVAHIRGNTISVIDLSMAIGGPPVQDLQNSFIIIAEYNRAVQGFLVSSVERIVNMNWSAIHPPPKGSGKNTYLTAVTEIEKELVEIIDVEKILSEIAPKSTAVSKEVLDKTAGSTAVKRKVLIADDSVVARNQVKKTVEQLGFGTVLAKDGAEALEILREISNAGRSIYDEFLMLISDIEMPEMDGYTLTAEIRNDAKLKELYILLHTSLSGVFNRAMVAKVGADDFIPKFNPDELAQAVQKQMNQQA
ncbi:chemotaxis protein CheV [Permianibacter aggregans]|uniref:Two-component system chemotaxis response regulator CheV n=1 Tax=Permianibacter aggregans TaxID=1510150 RepID=A0A4R6UTG5_9GAMM|nr:chemotaxis protein CheV [Permianibacter aggregans]QGX38305.1 chemotaxis signal transduction protein CheV [Permianibacter aggregans]TDQ48625.1 two-component system chemotaxis response regulator CheV [Permianibacter aggregans]